ncbi:MAG: shikimate kinase [Dinoroseobacter sp.]|nr:shikimate kinase [Dinoroseobacter sp.]
MVSQSIQNGQELQESADLVLKLQKPVVLVGMMGAGKTAVGTALAGLLDVPFLDSDREIEAAANATIAEIFARDGEAFFRDRETEVLTRLLQSAPGILSTGGGAFLAQRNRDVIAQYGVSVWLDADLELLWNRVRHKTTRPLLLTDDPKATLTEIYRARVPFYSKAQVRVPAAPELSIEQMAHRVREALIAAPGVLRAEAAVPRI